LPKAAMLISKKVKRFETEIKSFENVLNRRFKEGTTVLRKEKQFLLENKIRENQIGFFCLNTLF
jgi:hypothetical protein